MLVILAKLKFSFVLAGTLQSPHHTNPAFLTPNRNGAMVVAVCTLTGHRSCRHPKNSLDILPDLAEMPQGSSYPGAKSLELHKHCLHNSIIQLTVRGFLQIAVLTMLAIHGSLSFSGRHHPKLRELRSPFS